MREREIFPPRLPRDDWRFIAVLRAARVPPTSADRPATGRPTARRSRGRPARRAKPRGPQGEATSPACPPARGCVQCRMWPTSTIFLHCRSLSTCSLNTFYRLVHVEVLERLTRIAPHAVTSMSNLSVKMPYNVSRNGTCYRFIGWTWPIRSVSITVRPVSGLNCRRGALLSIQRKLLRSLLEKCSFSRNIGTTSTKVEVFVDKEVREAAPDREEKRVRWRNKKRVNSHLFWQRFTIVLDQSHTWTALITSSCTLSKWLT